MNDAAVMQRTQLAEFLWLETPRSRKAGLTSFGLRKTPLSAVKLGLPPFLDFIGTRIIIAHLDELFNKIHEYFN